MKKIILFTLTLICCSAILGQKKTLDFVNLDWPKLGVLTYETKISNNGEYVMYTVKSNAAGATLFIQPVNKSWKKAIPRAGNSIIAGNACFNPDNKFAFFLTQENNMGIVDLRKAIVDTFRNVRSFKIPTAGSGQWLAYEKNSQDSELMLLDLFSGREQRYYNVEDYYFNDSGNALVIKTSQKQIGSPRCMLSWLDLIKSTLRNVWEGDTVEHIVFDKSGERLAFSTGENSFGKIVRRLRYFESGSDSADIWFNGEIHRGDQTFVLSNTGFLQFSPGGRKLFFAVQLFDTTKQVDPPAGDVDVWTYHDEWLQSQQQTFGIGKNQTLKAVVNASDKRPILLEEESIYFNMLEMPVNEDLDYVIVKTSQNPQDIFWLKAARPSLFLVSTKNGEKTLLKQYFLDDNSRTFLSPQGKYVLWYDREKKHYFAHNVSDGSTKNITSKIPTPVYEEDTDVAMPPTPYGIAGWVKNDKAVLIYDHYDIWEVDPAGRTIPINVTNGFGRKSKIILRCIPENSANSLVPIVDPKGRLVLSAFNEFNKNNGFYVKKMDSGGDPLILSMGPYLYYTENPMPSNATILFNDYNLRKPIKAKYQDVYVLNRESVTEAPNLFVTRDFRTFIQLTDIATEKDYNWMHSELIRWKMFDGKPSEGILFKPENFDSTKRYPVIFNFYQKESNALNHFIYPKLSDANINIPWFVSNGYLVFVPNIYYKIGEPGESVFNAVGSAAQFLGRLPWVDSKHMGIQGHSFGGYEVNYLVTRTNMFAAAASASGCTNYVSMYNQLRLGGGNTGQLGFESSIYRTGATLWQKPQSFIRNSPVFRTDKVVTPLLIMHNKDDEAIPWSQAVEFFVSLRRLCKPVWMLQYNGERHGIYEQKNQLDYSIRLSQYFDHFLKGVDEPKWMKIGIPATLKKIGSGFETTN